MAADRSIFVDIQLGFATLFGVACCRFAVKSSALRGAFPGVGQRKYIVPKVAPKESVRPVEVFAGD